MDKNSVPMTLLIIEDEKAERDKFLQYSKENEHLIKFVGSTNSSHKGLEVVLKLHPEGIVLDLELHGGIGSGTDFLIRLKEARLDYKPIIIVTTNTPSSVVYNTVRTLGVDYIYYKKQEGYGVKNVIDSMLLFRGVMGGKLVYPKDIVEVDDIEESKDIVTVNEDLSEHSGRSAGEVSFSKVIGSDAEISHLIAQELDLIGMGRHYRGRVYLEKAIMLLVVNGIKYSEHVLKDIAKEFMVGYSSVVRAMQTAIENTWYDGDPEVLKQHYTTYVGLRKGRPTPNELIHFYGDKIQRLIEK